MIYSSKAQRGSKYTCAVCEKSFPSVETFKTHRTRMMKTYSKDTLELTLKKKHHQKFYLEMDLIKQLFIQKRLLLQKLEQERNVNRLLQQSLKENSIQVDFFRASNGFENSTLDLIDWKYNSRKNVTQSKHIQ